MFWFNHRQREQLKIIQLDSHLIESLGSRRHLKNIPYLLPKDIADQNRLDLQHFMLRQMMHGNYLAPIGEPQRILDVACGTGRWGAEMAMEFRTTSVVGFDLEPPLLNSTSIRLGNENAPNNYSFVKGNILSGLPFPDNSFDFVHMRMMLVALQRESWLSAVQEMYRVTVPGGWIELVDSVATDQVKTRAWGNFYKWLRSIGEKRQLDLEAGLHIGTHLRNVGMKQVQHMRIDIPIGTWGGSGGSLMATDYESVVRGLKGPIVQMGLTTSGNFDSNLKQMVKDMDKTRSYQPIFVAFGQKM